MMTMTKMVPWRPWRSKMLEAELRVWVEEKAFLVCSLG